MPPASLSTFAVMNPGPTTAKISRIRVFQDFSQFIGHVHRGFHNSGSQNKREFLQTTTAKCCLAKKTPSTQAAMQNPPFLGRVLIVLLLLGFSPGLTESPAAIVKPTTEARRHGGHGGHGGNEKFGPF